MKHHRLSTTQQKKTNPAKQLYVQLTPKLFQPKAYKAIVLALLSIGVFTTSATVFAAPRITATGLGTLGGTYSVANGLNDNGQVVGYAATTGNAANHAFLYNGSMQDLGTLGGTYSYAYGINNSGQVVGSAHTTGNTAQHAFLYNGSMQDLGTLGGTYSQAYGINNSGQVVGYAYTTGDAATHAFLYNGSMKDLGTLGGTYIQASAINNSGQVVGYSYTTGNTAQHAFLYNGSMQDLGTLGGTYSQASAINNSGQVVGNAATTGNAANHAFLYNGSMQDLGTLGGTYSSASAINNSGQVVGNANTTGNAATHAALWSGGKAYDLNSFAPSGWTYQYAQAINSYGQIAGYGTHGTNNEAYLLTLHPDWNGGDGYWDDYTSSHWNYGGLGAGALAGLNPGFPHDVVIAPTNTSATIYGSSNATVNSLVVGGSTGQLVTLNLNGGTTTTTNGTTLQANAVLAGSGRLAGNLTAQAGSTISVGGGQSMQLTGGTLTNGGTVSAIGTSANLALFSAGSTTLNQTTGKIQLQNANITFSGSINNAGQMVASFGNNNITGQVITLSGGKIILSGNSTNTFYDNVDIKSGGELRVSAGSSAVFFSLVNQRTGSTFSGTGSKAYEGGLSVGGSPGFGFDSGSVSFGDGNSYLAEIGGTTACTVACDTNDALKNSGFDKYQVVGKLTFGGELKLTSWLSFEAQVGQSFDLFDWGTTAGQFSSIDSSGFKLATGTGLDYSKLYTDGVISVVAVPETDTWAMLLAGLGVVGAWQRRRSLGACDESTV